MAMERQLAAHTDALIFESAYSADRYETQIGAAGLCHAASIPNGLAPDDFAHHAPAPTPQISCSLASCDASRASTSCWTPWHRSRAQQPVSAVIVGGGPDAAAFKAQAARLDLRAASRSSRRCRRAQAFRLGRALVVPSRAESFPYIVLEAAAAGMPLLATNVGGIPEIVDGTDTALLPADDPAALAEAMSRSCGTPQAESRAPRLRQRYPGASRWRRMTDEILALYAWHWRTSLRSTDPR